MKQIQLTITIKGRKSELELMRIAEGAVEYLMETFNDDESLKKVAYRTLPAPLGGLDLKHRVIAELSAWCEECEEIADAVTSTEEVVSYTERVNRIKALIKEVNRS